jgi:EAL and modified HD-GYP domain-containing signal transduction protein
MLFAARQGDNRSGMLLARVAVRARGIELLAKAAGLDKNTQDQGFMTGMFSLLGVLFGMPLAEVLAPLAIGEAVHGALLRKEGELGALLAAIEAAERGHFGQAQEHLAALQVSAADFNLAIADATRWMLGTVREVQGSGNG